MTFRSRSLYSCFIGAVFIVSIYNFAALTVLNDSKLARDHMKKPTHSKTLNFTSNTAKNDQLHAFDDTGLDENMQIEMEEPNNHVFEQKEGQDTLEEMESVGDVPPELKIFWPPNVEFAIPESENSLETCENFRQKVTGKKVFKIIPATWDRCGRPNNAYAELADGTRFCIRHRNPHDFLTAGESLSFQMMHFLSMSFVACTVLDTVYPLSKWPIDVGELGWQNSNDTIALTQWIPSFNQRVRLPSELLDRLKKKSETPLTVSELAGIAVEKQIQLTQWSDVIVFDFLTSQYDRVASIQDEADKQNQTALLGAPIRNMATDSHGFIWLFDNEGGFLDGYTLLYEPSPRKNDLRFQRFHKALLNSICIFRRSTIHAIKSLYRNTDPLEKFLAFAQVKEPLLKSMNFRQSTRFQYLRNNFFQRLGDLVGHFSSCSDLISHHRIR